MAKVKDRDRIKVRIRDRVRFKVRGRVKVRVSVNNNNLCAGELTVKYHSAASANGRHLARRNFRRCSVVRFENRFNLDHSSEGCCAQVFNMTI